MTPVYWYDSTALVWKSAGRPSIPTGQVTSSGIYSDANKPTVVTAGKSVYDNLPAGVSLVNASTISSTDDAREFLEAADSRTSGARYTYIVLDDERERTFYDFRNYNTSGGFDWRGFSNSQRRVMGIIDPTNGGSPFTISPTAVNDTPGCRAYVLDPPYVTNATTGNTNYTSPIPVRALYLSGANSSGVGATNVPPLFLSGLHRKGTLQTPLSLYSAHARSKMARNQNNLSPLAWGGDAYWAGKVGSRIQYNSWEGWGFSINSAPPYEMGLADTNRNLGITFEYCDWDGRLAADIDPDRHRVGGGMMLNKDTNISIRNSWLHHTRRSGFAMNTNTNNTSERYEAYNFQIDHVADVGDDGWISDIGTLPGQFGGSNVEGLVGQFFYENVRFNDVYQLGKINIAIPRVFDTGQTAVIPTDRPMIVAKNVTTNDTLYGGCVRVNVSKTPNSTGTSAAWERVNTLGIAGSGLFEFRNAAGDLMTGVRTTSYNASIHRPDTHFVVNY